MGHSYNEIYNDKFETCIDCRKELTNYDEYKEVWINDKNNNHKEDESVYLCNKCLRNHKVRYNDLSKGQYYIDYRNDGEVIMDTDIKEVNIKYEELINILYQLNKAINISEKENEKLYWDLQSIEGNLISASGIDRDKLVRDVIKLNNKSC